MTEKTELHALYSPTRLVVEADETDAGRFSLTMTGVSSQMYVTDADVDALFTWIEKVRANRKHSKKKENRHG